jgi:hypothetical protein
MLALAMAAGAVLAACGSDDGGDESKKKDPNAKDDKNMAGACTPGVITAGRAPLRRLTAAQYTNTLRDLFPGVTLPKLTVPEQASPKSYDNNADVQAPSPVLVEAYRSNAVAISAAVLSKMPCGQDDAGFDASKCGDQIIAQVGRRVLRRPLEADETAAYSALFKGELGRSNFAVAAQVLLQAMLQSASFLYLPEGQAQAGDAATPLSPHELASRLSYFLWNSTPDDALLDAADQKRLGTPADVEKEARRMLADPRAREAVTRFHDQWLDMKRLDTTTKDPAAHPSWSADLRDAMRTEADKFVETAIFEGDGTLASLFTSNKTQVNATLALVYGVAAPTDGSWKSVTLDPSQRAGILTLPAFLASHAHVVEPSPVLRGVFVLDRILCAPSPPPPPGITTNLPANTTDIHTNRDRNNAHVTNPACAGCHARIDGIGFSFESFDSLGTFRTTDNGYPVDSTGRLSSTDVDGPVDGATSLAKKLASSKQVHACVTQQWFRYAAARDAAADDKCTLDALDAAFRTKGDNIKELLVTLVTSQAFTHRPAAKP